MDNRNRGALVPFICGMAVAVMLQKYIQSWNTSEPILVQIGQYPDSENFKKIGNFENVSTSEKTAIIEETLPDTSGIDQHIKKNLVYIIWTLNYFLKRRA